MFLTTFHKLHAKEESGGFKYLNYPQTDMAKNAFATTHLLSLPSSTCCNLLIGLAVKSGDQTAIKTNCPTFPKLQEGRVNNRICD